MKTKFRSSLIVPNSCSSPVQPLATHSKACHRTPKCCILPPFMLSIKGDLMQVIRLFSLFILLTISLIVPAAKLFAQQNVQAPTRLALEVTFYPGRKPTYEPVPGPDSKPSG